MIEATTLGRLPQRRAIPRDVVTGLLILLESLVVMAIGFSVYGIYVAPKLLGNFQLYLGAIVIYALVLSQLLYVFGLYRLDRYVRLRDNWPRLIAKPWVALVLLVFFGFALKISSEYSRIWAIAWVTGLSVALPVFRLGATRLLFRFTKSGYFTMNVAIFGSGANTSRLVELIENRGEPWNRIVGIYDDRYDRVPRNCAGRDIQGNAESLVGHVRKYGCDEVLLAMPLAGPERYVELTEKLRSLPVNVRIVPDLSVMSVATPSTSIDSTFGIPMITLLAKPMSGWGAFFKRAIDIFLTLVILIFALPAMGLIAVLIKLDNRGPTFFIQKRLGFQNDAINVYKFRTMYADSADKNAEQLVTRGDPRVTRVGRILRRFSLDELPQLLNVLVGDMSLVGPRPHAMSAKAGGKFYADVTEAYYHRIRMKPGVTGWAQVNGWRGNTETEEDLRKRVEYDLHYIDNWSLALDLRILVKTIWIVLMGKRSY